MKKKIIFITDHNKLFKKCADKIRRISIKSIKQKGFCSIALSGGKTPIELFKILSSKSFSKKIIWDKIFFFQVDERAVTLNDPRRNFKLIKEYLFKPLQIKQKNIYFPDKDLSSTNKSVINYENKIFSFFKKNKVPGFDLIMLGIGEDGHTASIFPEDKKAHLKNNKIVIQTKPKFIEPKVKRITLTMDAINKSKYVIFLVTGENKKSVIKKIINFNPVYPASLVNPSEKLYLYYDNKI